MPLPSIPAALRHDTELALAALAAGLAVARAGVNRHDVRLKGPNDPVTAVDLATEAAIREVLTAGSPLPVQGEEGSPAEHAADRWVVDPVDGTANFVAGIPLVASTLARMSDDDPVIGVTADLTTGETFWAVRGAGAWRRTVAGDEPLRTLVEPLDTLPVTVGDASWTNREPWPMSVRVAALREVAAITGRVRVVGSSATELAWVAAGRTAGAVLWGNNPWDVDAGVVLVRESGGVVLDAHGDPWRPGADSVLAAASGEVAEALAAAVARATP